MNKENIRIWFKSKSRTYWVLTGIIAGFIIIGIVCGIIAMYASGYTIVSWFLKFGWLCVIIIGLLAVIGLGALFIKTRD